MMTTKIKKWVVVLVAIVLGAYLGISYFAGSKSTVVYPSPTVVASPAAVGCQSNSDCKSGETCQVVGPIIAGQPEKRVCVPKGGVVPL